MTLDLKPTTSSALGSENEGSMKNLTITFETYVRDIHDMDELHDLIQDLMDQFVYEDDQVTVKITAEIAANLTAPHP
tara:strand:+ start:2949 stop:3179 length:231 start_codon:yes stop_codon:yes gene_type:complete